MFAIQMSSFRHAAARIGQFFVPAAIAGHVDNLNRDAGIGFFVGGDHLALEVVFFFSAEVPVGVG
ncbi:MAG: hypothetical protein U0452_09960 [Anaerolineae bacterium]